MALPSGQLQEDEERELSPAISEGSVRTILVRLFPNGYQQKKIKLVNASAKL
ncbi:transposase [Sulfolobus sp. A20]|uniref:transposase n=1 Tax=Sulfolobaceae TaxID=118883 RepID=UPI0008461F54|nr:MULTISPECIES: transposase [unclassified Sulfolobus]AOL15483.1 transposase [Sulfolobus sp. A20]